MVDLQGGIVEHPDRGTVALSPLEARLVRYLVAAGDRLVPKEELLIEVWGYREGVVTRAVDNMLRRLRRKLEPVAGEVRHLENRYGQGIRLVDFESEMDGGATQPLERELPEYQGALHGRSGDQALVAESLTRSRLVTITGTGGGARPAWP
jgi:DNA-binding winged helix-turn-helix (wHTH) protein